MVRVSSLGKIVNVQVFDVESERRVDRRLIVGSVEGRKTRIETV